MTMMTGFFGGFAYLYVGIMVLLFIDDRWPNCIERTFGGRSLTAQAVLALWPAAALLCAAASALRHRTMARRRAV